MSYTIFISHAHEDSGLVKALADIFDDTLDDVAVRSSSARPARGGIEPGAPWLEWIHKSVVDSEATIIVITSASYQRPWLLWEAGAVSGVSMAVDERKPIIPLVFEMSLDDIPAPLRHHQLAAGDDADGIRDVLEAIYDRIEQPRTRREKFQRLVSLRVPDYVAEVDTVLSQRSVADRSDSGLPEPLDRYLTPYDKTFQGEDLDLTIVNFTPKDDPEDLSGVTIVNGPGDWMIEIDVESSLRGTRHAADMRFRRGEATGGGHVSFRIDSGEVEKHEEIIDLSTVRYEKYVLEYLVFRHVSRVAKIQIRPLDQPAKQAGVFCLDSVSVYSLPRGVAVLDDGK